LAIFTRKNYDIKWLCSFSPGTSVERLRNISDQGAIPETIQEQYVHTVLGCRIGNGYGVCWAAISDYDAMIRAFSPREISIAVGLPRTNSLVGRRIQSDSLCRTNYGVALKLIDRASVPSGSLKEYDKYIK
jgi:hypothetical protein